MEQDTEKCDDSSLDSTSASGNTSNGTQVVNSTGINANNSPQFKHKEQIPDINEAHSPSGSEASNCDGKLLNDSNNSDTNSSLIKGFEGATVCDSDSGSQEREISQNDSAVAIDISVSNSFSTTPQCTRSESSIITHTSTPMDSKSNDSGVHLDKSIPDTNSAHSDIAKAISNQSCDSENDVSNHSETVAVDKDSCEANDNHTKSADNDHEHDTSCKAESEKAGENYEQVMEAMVTEEMQGCTKTTDNSELSEEKQESMESKNANDGEKVDMEQNEGNAAATASSTNADTSSSTAPERAIDSDRDVSDDLDADVDSIVRLRRQLRRRRVESDSSSDLSDDDAGPGLPEDDKSDENDDAAEEEDDRPVPKDPWRHIHNLRQREFGFNSTLLASGSDDLEIAVWNWMKDSPYFVFESGHRSNVFQCKFMPYTGDSHIVSCARDGQVRLAELSSTGVCKGTKKLAQHKGAAHKLALLEDSSHELYSCGEDALVHQIDLREPKPQKLCTAKEKNSKVALYSIHANPFKSYEFCTGGRDHYIRVYDKRMVGNEDGECTVKKFCPHHLVDSEVKANVTCAVYNWNGTEVLGTYNDEDIYMFDNEMSEGAEYIHKYTGHRNNATVKGVNYYGPHSEYIVSGSDCGHVFLWERNTERIVNYFHADTGGVVNVLEPHPTMPMLATSGLDSDVKLWLPTAQEPAQLKGLAKRMKKNKKERDDERSNEPDMLDGRMLWFLMNHLSRVRRRRAAAAGGGGDADDSDDDTNSEQDSDNDSHSSGENPMECVPS